MRMPASFRLMPERIRTRETSTAIPRCTAWLRMSIEPETRNSNAAQIGIVHRLSMLSASPRTPNSRPPRMTKKNGRWKTTRSRRDSTRIRPPRDAVAIGTLLQCVAVPRSMAEQARRIESRSGFCRGSPGTGSNSRPAGRKRAPPPCSPPGAASKTCVGPTSSNEGLAAPQPHDQKWDASTLRAEVDNAGRGDLYVRQRMIGISHAMIEKLPREAKQGFRMRRIFGDIPRLAFAGFHVE